MNVQTIGEELQTIAGKHGQSTRMRTSQISKGLQAFRILTFVHNMDPMLLFIVEDAFQINGRGCVLAPGPSVEPGAQIVRVGDRIRLLKPNGEIIDSVIRGLEMLGRRPRSQVITAPILLPKDITKADVPKGTKVILLGVSETAKRS